MQRQKQVVPRQKARQMQKMRVKEIPPKEQGQKSRCSQVKKLITAVYTAVYGPS